MMRFITSRSLQRFVLTISMLLLPLQQTLAATPQADIAKPTIVQPAVVRDIALAAGQALRGRIMDGEGQPVGQVPVRLVKMGTTPEAVAVVHTDDAGRFEFRDVSAGMHMIESLKTAGLYRVWATDAAPPAAIMSAEMVEVDPTVRGQMGSGLGFWGWTLIGVGVAAAIAIPLALDDDDDDAS